MADILEGTHPTRMELLQLKNKLRLARKGHRLLKEKRDTLLTEFMRRAREATQVGDLAAQQMEKSRKAWAEASALAGPSRLLSASLAPRVETEADVEFKHVMGIQLPTIRLDDKTVQIDRRGWGVISTHPSVDVAAEEYESALRHLIALAQTEQSLLALSREVKKVKRRVNALEYKVIPRLENTQKYIYMRLEEFEREGFHRRKMIKRRRNL